jgi:hypothetical protein
MAMAIASAAIETAIEIEIGRGIPKEMVIEVIGVIGVTGVIEVIEVTEVIVAIVASVSVIAIGTITVTVTVIGTVLERSSRGRDTMTMIVTPILVPNGGSKHPNSAAISVLSWWVVSLTIRTFLSLAGQWVRSNLFSDL